MTEQKNSNDMLSLPLLPLKDIVVFPNMIVPVFVNEDLCVNAVEQALEVIEKFSYQLLNQ